MFSLWEGNQNRKSGLSAIQETDLKSRTALNQQIIFNVLRMWKMFVLQQKKQCEKE